jgi:hypothetical protein
MYFDKLRSYFHPPALVSLNVKQNLALKEFLCYSLKLSIGSDGDQPSDVRGKEQCKSAAVPQLC